MYIPPAYGVEDLAKIRAFIHTHGFATVVAQKNGTPWASHLPVLLDESTSGDFLRSHMARANEQWQHFASAEEVLCIFHGPHAYISPSWYESTNAVPTWNYATVHVYGKPRVETDPMFLRKVLDDTTSKYESKMDTPWKMNFPEETVSALMKAIVAFSIQITRVEAKFKLGQNRSRVDQAGMLSGLGKSSEVESRLLAQFIQQENENKS